ncbi:RHS repeat-associated core domain-containing protein [Aneurinibacillus migulanus]|uniref:RHS repeat domain-containing protein n=1 Tax=Aneurinibacillus migulanus TaxID=47500 RepID=UPI002E20832D|nr:RHS repeat-associated core domain-containing protein [Aneurinibacillus migulanus]
MKEFAGKKDFIPFRYQGQYEDIETGLYYNRFRYYLPNEGMYTQIDPIDLRVEIRLCMGMGYRQHFGEKPR